MTAGMVVVACAVTLVEFGAVWLLIDAWRHQ